MAPTTVLSPRKPLPRQSRHSTKLTSDDEDQSAVVEKDETERRLEKLLFGDEAGFLDSLQNSTASGKHALLRVSSKESDEDAEGDGLNDVADEDVSV